MQTQKPDTLIPINIMSLVASRPLAVLMEAERSIQFYCFMKKNPSPAPWAIKGIDGTRWFYDFNSAATFLVHVYGRKRPLTQRQYTQVLSALHKHQKSGEPFVMPELKKSKKLNP